MVILLSDIIIYHVLEVLILLDRQVYKYGRIVTTNSLVKEATCKLIKISSFIPAFRVLLVFSAFEYNQ